MPHLQFEMNFAATYPDKSAFAERVKALFAEIMDTGTDHIGITLRAHGGDDLFFGRAVDPGAGIVFLNADIRDGRSADQKRRLALAIIDELHQRWQVPKEAIYIVYTERPSLPYRRITLGGLCEAGKMIPAQPQLRRVIVDSTDLQTVFAPFDRVTLDGEEGSSCTLHLRDLA